MISQTGIVAIDGWLKLSAPAQTAVLFKELRLTLHSILRELIRKPEVHTQYIYLKLLQLARAIYTTVLKPGGAPLGNFYSNPGKIMRFLISFFFISQDANVNVVSNDVVNSIIHLLLEEDKARMWSLNTR